MASLDQLKATIASQKEQLAATELQLKTLYPDEGRIYSVTDADVLALAKNDKVIFKREWKRIIEEGLVGNVQRILEECRDYFLYEEGHEKEFREAAKKVMGAPNSKEWATFTLDVIKHLKRQGSFGDGVEDEMDNFEDTAGGCDEVTQDAAIAVIEAAMATE
jgi:hypothetical protein